MSPLSAAARSEWSRQLVRALVTAGYAGEEDLVPLLSEAAQTGSQVGPMIISRQLVPAPVVVSILAQLSRLPKVDLDTNEPTASLIELIPAPHGRDFQALPLQLVGQQVVVAFSEPPDPTDVRALSELIGYEIVPVLGDPLFIQRRLSAPNGSHAAPLDESPGPQDSFEPPAPSSPARRGRRCAAAARARWRDNQRLGSPSRLQRLPRVERFQRLQRF